MGPEARKERFVHGESAILRLTETHQHIHHRPAQKKHIKHQGHWRFRFELCFCFYTLFAVLAFQFFGPAGGPRHQETCRSFHGTPHVINVERFLASGG